MCAKFGKEELFYWFIDEWPIDIFKTSRRFRKNGLAVADYMASGDVEELLELQQKLKQSVSKYKGRDLRSVWIVLHYHGMNTKSRGYEREL